MSPREILNLQFTKDFACSLEDVTSPSNIFTYSDPTLDRRKFEDAGYLQVACLHGKLLMTGQPEIIDWCREKYKNANAPWFMEYQNLRKLDDRLQKSGYRIGSAHPFFIADTITAPPEIAALHTLSARSSGQPCSQSDTQIHWYEGAEIDQFRGDSRFDEAFAFHENAPDMLGVSLVRNGEILGMAGASKDSALMYQIGINVAPQARGQHIGSHLVALLKNELLRRGILPFYGTALSHIASQNVARCAGFYPAWAELIAQPGSNVPPQAVEHQA